MSQNCFFASLQFADFLYLPEFHYKIKSLEHSKESDEEWENCIDQCQEDPDIGGDGTDFLDLPEFHYYWQFGYQPCYLLLLLASRKGKHTLLL